MKRLRFTEEQSIEMSNPIRPGAAGIGDSGDSSYKKTRRDSSWASSSLELPVQELALAAQMDDSDGGNYRQWNCPGE